MAYTDRTAALLGEAAVARLAAAHVCVVGLGGVGSFAAEALVRAGVGTLTLVDCDCVEETNLNRQLYALHSTLGQNKAVLAAARAADIFPGIRCYVRPAAYTCQSREVAFEPQPDYILDCIDSLRDKADLVRTAFERGVPILSAMGTGNKTDPSALRATTLDKTSGCPLARALRRELRGSGCERLAVVYSTELPHAASPAGGARPVPASCAWVPSSAGLMMAGLCVRALTEEVCLR